MRRILPLILALPATLVASSCSLRTASQNSVHLVIPSSAILKAKSQYHALNQSTAATYSTTPSSLSDFDCFAVNVKGPGIAPPNPNQCTTPSDNIGAGAGWVANVVGSDVALDVQVPSGPARVIEIYGVRTPDACPVLGDFSSSRLSDVYLIGTTTQDIFNDTNVSIHASLDISAKALTSCRSSTTASVAATYYVLGPTGTGVSLPVPNGNTLTSVSATAQAARGTVVEDDGTHANFVYQPNSQTGLDSFEYTYVDGHGNPGSAKIVIKNVTPATWTGGAGDGAWSTAGNWCHTVNAAHSACNNDGNIPISSDTVIFDGTSTPGGNVTIGSTSVYIQNLIMDPDFTGTVVQTSSSTGFNITGDLKIASGTLLINSASHPLTHTGVLSMAGGTIQSVDVTGMSIGTSGITVAGGTFDISAITGSTSIGSLTVAGGTFKAPDAGTLTVNGYLNFQSGLVNFGTQSTAFTTLLNNLSSPQNITLNGEVTFQNLRIQSVGTPANYSIVGSSASMIVQHSLYLDGASVSGAQLNGGVIHALGNVTVESGTGGYLGNTSVSLEGPGVQTISDNGSANYPDMTANTSGALNFNNQSALTLTTPFVTTNVITHAGPGALTLAGSPNIASLHNIGGNLSLLGQINGDLTIDAGTVDLTDNLTVTGLTTVGTGTILNKNGHTLTGTTTGSGTINN